MKRFWLFSILTIMFVAPLLTACQKGGELTFSELVSQPQKYNGQTVTFEGYYFSAFEMSALCGSLQASSYPEGGLKPEGDLIWFNGGLPEEVFSKLQTQGDLASGYPQHFGKLKVTGRFEAGGQHGHLGGYAFQITPTTVTLLKWSP